MIKWWGHHFLSKEVSCKRSYITNALKLRSYILLDISVQAMTQKILVITSVPEWSPGEIILSMSWPSEHYSLNIMNHFSLCLSGPILYTSNRFVSHNEYAKCNTQFYFQYYTGWVEHFHRKLLVQSDYSEWILIFYYVYCR